MYSKNSQNYNKNYTKGVATMRVALYPRVSGHEQEDNYSIPEQIDRMKKYCESRDWKVYKIYTDSGFTGSNMDRPGLQNLIKDTEKDVFDMVLVYKLDRLSRSQKDVLYLVEDVFDKHGIYFSSMTENFDTSTPFGKAILGILAVFAQLEREQIKERTMMGKQARAEEGKWHGSKWVPIGYDYKSETDMLIINEYEAMQIKEAAELFVKRTPVRTIANILNEKGYRHKHGDGEWEAKTVRRVLSNPTNIGLMKHRDKYYQGLHEPILDYNTYADIMKIMDERKEQFGSTYKQYSTLLGGMIYCKHCGAKYTKQRNGSRFYYSCYSRSKKMKKMIKDPNCKNKNYNMLDLDFVVIEAITQLALDPEYIEQVRENKPKNDVGEKIKTITKEIESIDSQISNMMDLYSLGNMPIEVIGKKVTALNTTKTELEKELDSLDVPENDDDGMTNEQIQTLADIINNKDLTLEDKRNIVQSLIYYIEIDNEDILIHWKF
jgi:site-specific DNA recombinase